MLINRSFETRINTILDQLIGTCFAQARNSSQLPHTRQPLFHDVNFPWWLLPDFSPFSGVPCLAITPGRSLVELTSSTSLWVDPRLCPRSRAATVQ
jgi:hypothetical protein